MVSLSGAHGLLLVDPGHSFGQVERTFVDGAAGDGTLKVGFHAQGIEGLDVVQSGNTTSGHNGHGAGLGQMGEHGQVYTALCAVAGDIRIDDESRALVHEAGKDFINGEARYTRLAQAFPERAKELFEKAETTAKAKYERLKKLVDFYNV